MGASVAHPGDSEDTANPMTNSWVGMKTRPWPRGRACRLRGEAGGSLSAGGCPGGWPVTSPRTAPLLPVRTQNPGRGYDSYSCTKAAGRGLSEERICNFLAEHLLKGNAGESDPGLGARQGRLWAQGSNAPLEMSKRQAERRERSAQGELGILQLSCAVLGVTVTLECREAANTTPDDQGWGAAAVWAPGQREIQELS